MYKNCMLLVGALGGLLCFAGMCLAVYSVVLDVAGNYLAPLYFLGGLASMLVGAYLFFIGEQAYTN